MRRVLATEGLVVALVVVAGVLASVGCGGGGGGGGPTAPPPVTPPSGVTYSADSPASANSVNLGSGQGGSGSVWVMEVRVQSVTDLYGVSFVLEYPSNLLSYRKKSESEGSFMDGGGEFDTELIVKERNSGEVTVGISRIGLVPGATGSGDLLSLEFSIRGTGSGAVTMTEATAVDSLGVEQEDVTFISGSVNVRSN